jgi:hypothetical protein
LHEPFAALAVVMAEYADDQYAHGQQYTDDQAYPTQEFAPQDKSDAQQTGPAIIVQWLWNGQRR